MANKGSTRLRPKPGENAWDDRLNPSNASSELNDRENSSGASDKTDDSASNDLGDAVRGGENAEKPWENNYGKNESNSQSKTGRLKEIAGQVIGVTRKKGAIGAFIALLTALGGFSLLAPAALPASIIGNRNIKSQLIPLGQYDEDFLGFRLFTGKKGTVSTTGSKIKGLYNSEIEQLKLNGVELEGASKQNPITRKTTFESVKYKGQVIHAGAEFKTAIRADSTFRRSMTFNKGSLWKANKSSAAASVRKLFGLKTNPDVSGKTVQERNQKLYDSSVNETQTDARAAGTQDNPDDPNANPDKNAQVKADAEDVAGELNKEVDAEKAAIKKGNFTPEMARAANMADVTDKLAGNGFDVIDGATEGLGGKVWGYVNALSPITMVCTMYQVANTASVLARTVALFNVTRFAVTTLTTLEKMLAGDDDGQSTAYIMNLIQLKDPETGQSFDETSYAAMLFNGELSSEPSAVSAFGGQAMIALYLTMHAVHSVFGDLAKGFTLGALKGSAGDGRRFLKDVCGLATNFGVQIGATAVSLVVAVFTGGASAAGQVGAATSLKAGITGGFKAVTNSLVKVFSKGAVKALAKKEGGKIAEQGIFKYLARNSWKGFMEMWSHMTPWDKVGLLIAGVSTFGMSYIVDTLAGGNIAGLTKNGFAAFDAIGTGWNQYETVNGIASGGNLATYAQATAYQQTQQDYQASYIADLKYDAKDTPFDVTKPYSTLGMAVFGMQKMIGISASLKLPSTLGALATLPFKLPTLFMAHAGTKPTPKQIGDQVSNPFYQENQLAVTTTGSAQVIFAKHYSFAEVIEQLVDSANPQVFYEGNDEKTGEPKFTIMDTPNAADGTLSLSNYAKACHNAERTEPDPEFASEGDDNVLDTNLCVSGGEKYNESVYPLYDDAIRFIGQISPDASNASGAALSPNNDPTTKAETGAGTTGRDDVPAAYKANIDAHYWHGMIPGQCSSFAAWRMSQQWYGSLLLPDGSNWGALLSSHPLPGLGSSLSVGNGIAVAGGLIKDGIADRVDGLANAQPGDIVSVSTRHAAGHVYVVLSNNGSTIEVEEYNYNNPKHYGTRTLSISSESNIVVSIARVHKNGGNK